MLKLAIFFLLSSTSVFLRAENIADHDTGIPPPNPDPKMDEKYGFAGLPVAGYSSGFGTGFGAVGSFYKKQKGVTPYKYEIDGQIYFMTSGMQSHKLRFDFLEVWNLPLRLRPMLGLLSLPNENYCGQGMRADCSIPNADPNYYLTRYWEVFGILEGRWRLKPMPSQIEIYWAWRGSSYHIGHFGEKGPYPNSLYAKDFKDDIGNGFASVMEAGVIVDNRDFEPAPSQGYMIEATLRESSTFWGSSWNYLGANLSLRGYLPLISSKKLVLAGQIIFDGMSGEAPLQEIVRIGGSGRYFNTFGGQEIGRGLREQYFPGRLKAYKQAELRYDFFGFNLWHWHLDLTAAAFTDFGVAYWSYDTLDGEKFRPAIGFGGGLRILWDRAIVIRFDIGSSPIENYAPKFYFVIGNVF